MGRRIERTDTLLENSCFSRSFFNEIGTELRTRYAEALQLLTENREILDTIAEALLEREVLEGEEVGRIVRGEVLPPPRARKRTGPAAGDKGAVAS